MTDHRIFGRFKTAAGRCLLIDNELHKPTISHRLDVVAEALGISRCDYGPRLDIWPVRGKLPSLAEVSAEIRKRYRPGELRAIGYDAMYRFLPGGTSENDNSAMKEVYNVLDKIGEHTRAVNIVIHHASKGDQSQKKTTDVGAGAGSQARAADSHLILREHEEPGFSVLEGAVRSFTPLAPIALKWDFPLWLPADGIDPTRLKGKQTAGEQRQSERDKQGINLIIDALLKWTTEDGPATPRKLRAKTKLSKDRIQKLLDQLVEDGQIVAVPITIKGNQTNEYQLPKDTE